jgi:adenosylhomocysteine nucleosidase
MKAPRPLLVCFAVTEEAAPLRRRLGARADIAVLVTGIGRSNAVQALRAAWPAPPPQLVLTCGFAGGLHPELAAGTVVFSAGESAGLEQALTALGARPVRFHCAAHVAGTAAEKAALRKSTGADAVEMESEVIRVFCRERQTACATVRVISDAAGEDLPLDFNRLMTSEQRLHFGKLLWAVLSAPGKIGGLLRLRRRTKDAARALAAALHGLIDG